MRVDMVCVEETHVTLVTSVWLTGPPKCFCIARVGRCCVGTSAFNCSAVGSAHSPSVLIACVHPVDKCVIFADMHHTHNTHHLPGHFGYRMRRPHSRITNDPVNAHERVSALPRHLHLSLSAVYLAASVRTVVSSTAGRPVACVVAIFSNPSFSRASSHSLRC